MPDGAIPNRGAGPLERLRAAGLRVTGPRLAILEQLQTDWEHPSAERIFASLRPKYPSLSLSTVYLALEAFIKSGLCRRVPTPDGRLRVDGTQHDHAHDHGTCRGCGAIFDIERGGDPMPGPPRRLPDGLRVVDIRIEYDVICGTCRGEREERNGNG